MSIWGDLFLTENGVRAVEIASLILKKVREGHPPLAYSDEALAAVTYLWKQQVDRVLKTVEPFPPEYVGSVGSIVARLGQVEFAKRVYETGARLFGVQKAVDDAAVWNFLAGLDRLGPSALKEEVLVLREDLYRLLPKSLLAEVKAATWSQGNI
jgi:hypothetical protein